MEVMQKTGCSNKVLRLKKMCGEKAAVGRELLERRERGWRGVSRRRMLGAKGKSRQKQKEIKHERKGKDEGESET